MHRGYIKLWRKFQDNFLWKEPRKFSKAEAWIDMIMEVQHKEEPHRVVIGNTILYCNRGESLKSLDTWSYRWRWSKSATRRFFNLLKKTGQIDTVGETVTTRIKIINYNTYCPLRNADGAEANSVRNASETQVAPDNNDKNVKNEKKEIIPYVEIINYLNAEAGKSFKANTKETRRAIRARWNEGFRLSDFQQVVRTKCAKWKTDERMVDYLRPQTLFGTKFESYLNESSNKNLNKPFKTPMQELEEKWMNKRKN